MLNGDDTLRSELLNLLGAVLLPVLDVGVVADTERAALWQVSTTHTYGYIRTYGEDDGADVIIKARGADSFLVGLGSTSLLGQNETGTNPDGGSTEGKGGRKRLAVEQATSGNDLDGHAGHRALGVLDQLGHSRDEDSGGDIASVATTFTTLGADDIGTSVKGLLDVLGVANHVHVEDSGLVELLDDGLRGDTDGAYKELSTALDDDVDKFIELSLGVIVASRSISSAAQQRSEPVQVKLTWSCERFHQPGEAGGRHRMGHSYRSSSS